MRSPHLSACVPDSSPQAQLIRHTLPASFVPFPRTALEQSIAERFEQQVRQYPERIAVKTPDKHISYDALNQAANRIARAILRQRCAGSEPIGLLCGQNIELIAAILGIVKSGKAYVPLDPTHPIARIQMMVDAAHVGLIVADADQLELAHKVAQSHAGAVVLCLAEISADESASNPEVVIAPETPAYIFYTSGTTGTPKGVVDHHRNVLHNILRYTNRLGICANDGLTLLQSASFSGSVSNIFGALLNGATLFPFDVRHAGLDAIAAWLHREPITIYHSVPAIFRAFLTGDRFFPRIRIIRLEGDQASQQDIALYKQHFAADCILVNGLGATECGIVRQYFITPTTEIAGPGVPIGYATEDMDVLVVDEVGNPVAAGTIGEIVVESRYLAPGYWRNSDLTSAAFRTTSRPDIRRYHTGDLGRMQVDGCLEHLGRKNFQAKIRGHLIDVAEVEATLLRITGIIEAVVVVREDEPGDPRLVAYSVIDRTPAPSITAIRHRLAESLPEYMIPAAYVFLDVLPLTANGKIDRRALPQPDQSRHDLATPFVAPRTPPEERLATIWTSVLKLERVGIHDNFFDLGGHSLLAGQVTTRIGDVFQLELPIRSLFEAPTIAGLTDLITELLLAEIEALPEPDPEPGAYVVRI